MINSEKLTVKAGEALNEAANLARRNGNPVVYDLHLLAALLEQDESIVVPILQKLGASVAAGSTDTTSLRWSSTIRSSARWAGSPCGM